MDQLIDQSKNWNPLSPLIPKGNIVSLNVKFWLKFVPGFEPENSNVFWNEHEREPVIRYHASDDDTAVDLMKKEEKMLVAELTIYYSQNISYKNTSELNAHIYSDKRIKDYFQRYGKTLKERNRSKIRYESFRSFRNDLRTKVVTERELAKHL